MSKKIIYLVVLLVLAVAIFFYSFKLGYQQGREQTNSFENLLNTNSALVNILELSEKNEIQKVKDVTKFFLINNLFAIINSYKHEAMPISTPQAYRAKADAIKVLQIMEQYSLNLYEKNQVYPGAFPTNEYFNNYVKENLEQFAQVELQSPAGK
jgi:hypothetical protein